MSASQVDILIIGGGTAGLVLAARLSENPELQILVLEAGQDQTEDPRVQIPALWPALVATDSDWRFITEPQAALNGKQIPQPQGRLLGGSSAINGMAFIANSKANIDAWAALGNPGWNWETISPYYKKAFSLTLPSAKKINELGLGYVDTTVCGSEGPVQASFPDSLVDPIAKAWVKTLEGLGYPMKSDPFTGEAYGGYTNAASIDPATKTRSYSANAYYLPAKGRSNLHVVTKAHVNRVLLYRSADGEIAATGAEYIKDGQTVTVKAQQEVIVAAGAYNSPKILELSGIGSATLLNNLGIPVIVDNPNVGENLQDHALAGLSYEVQDFINTKDDLMRQVPEVLGAAMQDFQTKQFGPFTVGGNYSSALLPLPDFSHPETGAQELDKVLSLTFHDSSSDPFANDLSNFVRCLLRNPHEATGGYFTYPAQSDFTGSGVDTEKITSKFPENYITICVSLMHPLSRGTCHIASANPADPPRINPRYLSHPADLDILARHTQFIDTIAASQPLASMLKSGGKRSPGVPDDLRAVSLDVAKDYVRSACKSTFHPTSTCAMMPKEKGGVVDARLRVWGVSNLRVVDASVIPIIPRGNTQSAIYAIAERAADLVLQDCEGRK
ncbi:glucose-methanol-choline oxidoreductase-like protein [Aspergillus karnatakaensis]|uniref:GMC family oxidoreductase n=1 Tax=Aspergillus karnatakaensis TaxID=1810916 RepID=UPI003CCD7335